MQLLDTAFVYKTEIYSLAPELENHYGYLKKTSTTYGNKTMQVHMKYKMSLHLAKLHLENLFIGMNKVESLTRTERNSMKGKIA